MVCRKVSQNVQHTKHWDRWLQQQKTTWGTNSVSQDQGSEATLGTDSLKLDSCRWGDVSLMFNVNWLKHFPSIYMILSIAYMTGWFENCMNEQVFIQMLQLKWPVSVDPCNMYFKTTTWQDQCFTSQNQMHSQPGIKYLIRLDQQCQICSNHNIMFQSSIWWYHCLISDQYLSNFKWSIPNSWHLETLKSQIIFIK